MVDLRNQIASWSGAGTPVAAAGPRREARTTAETGRASAERRPDYFEIKALVHQQVLDRIDLGAAEELPAEQLQEQLKVLVAEIVRDSVLPLNDSELEQLALDLKHEILGLGPLETLLADRSISEIMVNGARCIFVERKGKIVLSEARFDDDEHLLKIIDRIVSRVGRRIDESSPMVDARLADGSRINAIIPPLALDGPVLTIRRFSAVPLQIVDLLHHRALTEDMAALVGGLVKAKANIIVSGGTGSGKTTLLNILSGFIPEDERIITLEDTAELQLQQSHVVRLETRPANVEGKGAIPMRALLKNSLRMRPDRIVVGEVRGGEVIDMLQAMNTGHAGSMATIHANTPRDALARLENLVTLAGVQIPLKALRQQIVAAVDIIVQTARILDGSRKITSITEITGMEGDVITTQDIFSFEIQETNSAGKVVGEFRPCGLRPRFWDELIRHGVHLNPAMFDRNAAGK